MPSSNLGDDRGAAMIPVCGTARQQPRLLPAPAKGPAHHGHRRDPPGFPANRRRRGTSDLEACCRSAPPALAQARRADGRQRARRARLHDVPQPAPHQAALHQPARTPQKEVKRRADVVGIFPNEASINRLIGAVLLEQNDEWLLQCRYMQIEGMAELTPPLIDADPAKLPPMAA
jgi:hypothetical protein